MANRASVAMMRRCWFRMMVVILIGIIVTMMAVAAVRSSRFRIAMTVSGDVQPDRSLSKDKARNEHGYKEWSNRTKHEQRVSKLRNK